MLPGMKDLESIMKKFEDHLKKETLTEEIHYGEEHAYEEFNINGEALQIAVEVVK